ncbi:MAG TPA: lipoyl(octanoyl) transferase LipB [Fredinandcohnia sp.]|nr:lipoyl(octanoyl) transferase LipB [Fredinandcohnia sp.]
MIVRKLGLVEYEDGLALMQTLARRREAGEGEDVLLLLEHPPVLTLGRAAKRDHILLPPEELERRGVRVFETDRGGDVTYHGPGQLVGYPVFDLKPDRKDVRRYVGGIEEAVIRTLADYGITAGRIPKWTGVWVGEEDDPTAVKVCAIGVHIRKWITTHGFAFNVRPDLTHFGMIVPCGIRERGVTSLSELLGRPVGLDEVAERVAARMAEVFESEPVEAGFDRETVSVAVLRPAPAGVEALVLERTPERGGFPQIVTGAIQAGETPLAAARRELFEETGLEAEVRPLDYVHAFGMGDAPLFVREHAHAAWVPAGAGVRIQPEEHVSARWLPLEEAIAAMPFRGLAQALRRAFDTLAGHR